MADDHENADDDDRLLLEASSTLLLGDGDDFITEEQRIEEAAAQRRLERQRKRRKLFAHESSNNYVGDGTPSIPPPSQPSTSNHGSNKKVVNNTFGNNDNDDGSDNKDDGDDDNDMFNMFSSSVSPPPRDGGIPKSGRSDSDNSKQQMATFQDKKGNHQRDFDDSEGYYKATIGEIIPLAVEGDNERSGSNKSTTDYDNIKVRVQGIIGKGVFSSVLKCSVISTTATAPSQSSLSLPPLLVDQKVALKCIRSNETMTKSAMNEIKFLQRLSNCVGIVQLLLPTSLTTTIEYHGHFVMVFPYEPYNLRDVLIKFGKGVGLSLMAVKNFFGQLLAAATHLIKHKILHADIKPDNLLVSESYSQIVIADFGSAMDLSDPNNTELITPYLASRFYRAPEIIMGLPPTYSIDLWSLAVTAAEIFLGNVLFQGTTNNDMLYKMMSYLGPFSNRMIRRHLLQAQKNPIPTHFTQNQTNYFFRQESVDPVFGQAVHKEISMTDTSVFKNSLQSKLLKARSPKDSRSQVLLFADLLTKCLMMDPTKRISVKEALKHDFFASNDGE